MKDALWITGVSGFTGRHLARFVRSLPDAPRVVGLDVKPVPAGVVDVLREVNVCDPVAVCRAASVEPPRWIIHLAGLLPPASEPDMWRVNVGGTVALIAGLRKAGQREVRLLSVGSAAEYSPANSGRLREDAPTGGASPYGNTKLAQTLLSLQMAAESGFPAVVARPFNLIGPGLSTHLVAGALVRQFMTVGEDGAVQVGNTHTARDFLDVRDAVRAYWLLAASERARGIFNVCSGRSTRIEQLLELLARLSGRSPRIVQNPAFVRPDDPIEVVGDPTRLLEATGWRAELPVEQSLGDMMAET